MHTSQNTTYLPTQDLQVQEPGPGVSNNDSQSNEQTQRFDMNWSPSPPGVAPPPGPVNHADIPPFPNLPPPVYGPAVDGAPEPYYPAQQYYPAPPAWPGAPRFPPRPGNPPPPMSYIPLDPALDPPAPVHYASAYRYTHSPLQAEQLALEDAALEAKQLKDAAAQMEKDRKELEREQKKAEDQKKKDIEQAKKDAEKAKKDEEKKIEKAKKDAQKEKEKEEDRKKKEAETKRNKEIRDAKREVEKKERAAKRKAEKEAEAAKKQAEKEAEAATPTAMKSKSKAKSKVKPKATRASTKRKPADSDDKIKIAGVNPNSEVVNVKPIAKNEPTRNWTDEEAQKSIEYIMSVCATGKFKIKQTATFQHVSKYVLLGSKDAKQVGNHYNTCWKKFKACQRRAKHTGGGDGNALEQDEMREEKDEDSDTGDLSDKAQAAEDCTGASTFSEAQLNQFEQSEIYKLFLAVVGDIPEVNKPEHLDFDQARAFSLSPGPEESSKKGKSDESAEDRELFKQTFGLISTSMESFQASRKANKELAERREEREKKAELDWQVELQEEREFRKRRMDHDDSIATLARGEETRRIDLHSRALRIQEQEQHDKRWDRALIYLEDTREAVRRRGERMIKELEAEELGVQDM
ncbi:hypothetical protein FRC07_015046 [Ceratobasidium sp. 392]|nr:hypothetical protein FRC07_015046 [Ceratobasidium sp. 392]